MFRKGAIAVSAVLLGLVIVCYTSLPSLVQVKWHDTLAWFDRQVPIETQIKQLKLETSKIDNEIKDNFSRIAKMEVETKNLEQQVAALKQEQGQRKEEITTLANVLETTKVSSRDLHSKTNQLDLLVSTYEVKTAKLKSLENLLTAKRQTVESSHQKLFAMKAQRDDLAVTIAKLENRMELVDIKTQQSTIKVSDSKINECKALAKKIDDLLSEKEAMAVLERTYYPEDGKSVEKETTQPKEAVLKRAMQVLKDDNDDK